MKVNLSIFSLNVSNFEHQLLRMEFSEAATGGVL